MSIVAAHPYPAIFGALAILCCLAGAAYLRLTGEEGTHHGPRRGTRLLAGAARARRRVTVSACRRARAMRAWVTSWFWWLDSPAGPRPWQALRERAALRIHGITIDFTTPAAGVSPPAEGTGTGRLDPEPEGVPSPPPQDYTRKATGAERDAAAPWYAPEAAALSPWEHKTQWFSLDAIDADIQARAAAGGDA